MKASNLSLLPTGHDEFRTQQYWDRFFTKRSEAFEWYITFEDVTDIVKSHIKPTSSILVVGCGNSDMSARAYDAGFHQITNVDYSPVVIEEMQKRNKQRKEMRWLEMNMLDMKAFTDGTFDVAIDKGALDALYSGDTPQVRADAMRMSVELARVLKSAGGKYMCISLLEDHILAHLLRTFRALPGWRLDVYKIDEPRKDSNQLPFVLVFTRTPGTQGLPTVLHFDGALISYSYAAPAEQRAKHVADTDAAIGQQVKAARWQYLQRLQLQKLHDGAHQVMELWDKDPAKTMPRFTLAIIDNTRLLSHKVKGQCGVFITPQGRESEWLFATEGGHQQLSADLGYRRLIVVLLGRGHTYASLSAIQDELSPHIVPLAPLAVRKAREVIPYLSVGDDLGERRVLHEATSALSGPLVVEDVRVGKQWMRRLVFQQNKGLVQSECALRPAAKGDQLEPVHTSLASEYHAAIVSSLAFLAGGWKDVEFIIIGLGGATLPVFLHNAFAGAHVHVVEIDAAVVAVAEKYFGLAQSDSLRVTVADGLAFVAQLPATERKRVVIVDADSKDLSAGLSCPPAAFLEEAFLRSTADKVGKSGLFVVNIVCRAPDRFAAAVKSIESVFPATFSLKMQEDVNCVYIAMQQKPENVPHLVESFEAGPCKEKWAAGLELDKLCRRAAGLAVSEEAEEGGAAHKAPAAASGGSGGGRGKKKRR